MSAIGIFRQATRGAEPVHAWPLPGFLKLACGSRGHHGCVDDVLPGIIDGDNPIAIGHAMITDHISPLSRGKTIGLHASGKAETV